MWKQQTGFTIWDKNTLSRQPEYAGTRGGDTSSWLYVTQKKQTMIIASLEKTVDGN